MIVVSNTTVITTLLKSEDEAVLQKVFNEVLIPPAVCSELLSFHRSIPEFLKLHDLPDGSPTLQARGLGEGEREAISLALAEKADLFLSDDILARNVASRNALEVSGLIGITLRAKERGIIKSAAELLNRLERKGGLYLSEDLKREALRKAGE